MQNPWYTWSKRKQRRIIATIIAVLLLIALSGVVILPIKQTPPSIPYTTFMEQVKTGKIKEVTIDMDVVSATLTATLPNGKQVKTKINKDWTNPLEELKQHNVRISFSENLDRAWVNLFVLLGFVAIIFVWVYFYVKGIDPLGDINLKFWQSRTMHYAKGKHRTTFDDVQGIDEAKAELQEIVEFLKDPKEYERLGGRIPHGVLLIGPPGNGKTLLARAVAGEANVPFKEMAGSDFVEVYVGVGARNIRNLCDWGRERGRCVLFIDEIDSVGGKRTTPTGGGDREYQQTLDALLVEMDGFEKNPGVIFIGATNRDDILDPALLRPGRFDRCIHVSRPDIRGREAILHVHIRKQKIPLANDIDLSLVARATQGFSGAELANLVNEAALIGRKSTPRRDRVIQEDLIKAKDKIVLGPENKSHKRLEEDLKTSAHHETGHALTAALLQHARPVEKVTIVSRREIGGGVFFLPEEDGTLYRKEGLIAELAVLMGGRMAEQIFLKTLTSGAERDIEVANGIAQKMVCRWGMSELGPITVGTDESNTNSTQGSNSHPIPGVASEAKKQRIDEAIDKLIQNAEVTASRILNKHKELYEQLVRLLYEKETVDGKEIYEVVGKLRGSERA